MRALLFCLFLAAVLAFALPKENAYNNFLNSNACKKAVFLCSTCIDSKFETKSCNDVFKKFVEQTKFMVQSEYLANSFCKKTKDALCFKCLSSSFKEASCVNAKKIYLSLFPHKKSNSALKEIIKKDLSTETKKEEKVEEKKEEKKEEEKKVEQVPDTPVKSGLAQKAMTFFKAVSVGKGKAVKALGTTGISLYDGLPWAADGAYELDNEKMNTYEKNILNQKVNFSMASDRHCSAKGIEYDGIVASDFAALPILAFRDIDDAGMPINWSNSARPRKVAAILKDKTTGTLYYLPCTCVGDAKGHAWPGGLAQTFLSSSGQKKNAWKFNSDGGYITGPIIGKTVTSLSEIRTGYSQVKYNGAKVSVQLNLELNSEVKKHLKDYKLTGFIAWKQ